MAILPGQLDVDCGSMLQSQATTSCPQACLATLSMVRPASEGALPPPPPLLLLPTVATMRLGGTSLPPYMHAWLHPPQIGPDCRQELLACEYKLNSAQEAYGLPAFWLWRPLFGSCGLDGASGGGMQSPQPLSPPLASPQPFSPQPFIPQPFSPGLVSPSPDDADLEGPLLPSCSLTVEAAEAAGWAGACSSDHGCLSLESGTLDDNCTAVLESPPLCTDGCHAALGSVRGLPRTWDGGAGCDSLTVACSLLALRHFTNGQS